MLKVKIHPRAQEEVDATIAWYEEECEHLGFDFLEEVDRTINIILQDPAMRTNYGDMPAFHRINLHRVHMSNRKREGLLSAIG